MEGDREEIERSRKRRCRKGKGGIEGKGNEAKEGKGKGIERR